MRSIIWPVWSDSAAGPVRFEPKTRKQAAMFWHAATKWDSRTHEKGKHGGFLGHVAREVYRVLLFDFLNYRTGRCDPSVAGIAKRSGYCARAVHSALNLLRRLRLITWVRRCEESYDEDGQFRLRQRTNAYGLLPPTQWQGYEEDAPPLPSPDTLGTPEPVPDPIDAAVAEIVQGTRESVLAALEADPNDRLAMALASMGRNWPR